MTVRNLMDDMAEFVKLGYGDFEINLKIKGDNDIRYHLTRNVRVSGEPGVLTVEFLSKDDGRPELCGAANHIFRSERGEDIHE